jgi:hypothetical protein
VASCRPILPTQRIIFINFIRLRSCCPINVITRAPTSESGIRHSQLSDCACYSPRLQKQFIEYALSNRVLDLQLKHGFVPYEQ